MFQFAQHIPPPDLRAWIRLIWTMSVDAAPSDRDAFANLSAEADLVVPDGHAELIYNLGEPFLQQAPGDTTFLAQPAAIINGQIRRSVKLLATGRVKLVGIRVQPWALGALARVPASELTDRWEATHSVSMRLLPNLEDELRQQHAFDDVPRIIVRHLRDQVRRMVAPSSSSAAVVAQVARKAVSLNLPAIRRDVGMSERAMQRMFLTEVGLTAKQFARVLRVQHAVQFRRNDSRATWTQAAISAGYYDQPHFNKDFRTVVGCAPTELMVEPESLAGNLLLSEFGGTLSDD